MTLTRNDWHCLEQWRKFYEGYAAALDWHIVVDNASVPEYRQKIQKLFPQSVHLQREVNGGTTGAYDTGIRWVLENHPEVDAIMLIANDIRISAADVGKLYDRLMRDPDTGAMAPVLLQRDDKTICAFGERLFDNFGLDRLHDGEAFEPDRLPPEQPSECLPGGMCMVKTEVYRKVGLQDESLFMYFDENEFFYRTTQAGYKLAALRDAVAAHCHIVTEGKGNDSGLAWFYINRNQLLLCRQYRDTATVLHLFGKKALWTGLKYLISFIFREHAPKKAFYYYYGLFCGLFGIRSNRVTN